MSDTFYVPGKDSLDEWHIYVPGKNSSDESYITSAVCESYMFQFWKKTLWMNGLLFYLSLSMVNVIPLFENEKKEIYVTCTKRSKLWPK